MNELLKLLALIAVGVVVSPLLVYFVARPMKSVVPLYAFSIPIGDALRLPVPLPAPFDTMSSLLGGLALAACITHIALYKDARVPSISVGAWVAFMCWALATSLWALDSTAATRTLTIAFPLALLMIAVSFLPWQRSDLALLKVAIAVSGVVVAAYALTLLFTGRDLPTHGESVRFSVVSDPEETDPNLLAATLLLPFALSLELALTKGEHPPRTPRSRVVGVTGSLLIPAAIVLTGSRGGLISAAAVLVLTAFFCARVPEMRKMVLKMLATIAILVASLVYLYQIAEYFSPGLADRISSFDPVSRLAAPESSGRVQIWSTGYLACKEYCDYGSGIGNFANAYQQFYPYAGVEGNIGLTRPAHNTYLQLVVETGIVGLVLLMLALLTEWRILSVPRVSSLVPSLRATMIALLVAEFFLTAIWFKFFWLLFIVARASEQVAAAQDAKLFPTSPRARRFRIRSSLVASRD